MPAGFVVLGVVGVVDIEPELIDPLLLRLRVVRCMPGCEVWAPVLWSALMAPLLLIAPVVLMALAGEPWPAALGAPMEPALAPIEPLAVPPAAPPPAAA